MGRLPSVLTRQSRRRIAAALTLVGVALFAAAGMLVLTGRAAGGDPRLETGFQLERSVSAPAQPAVHPGALHATFKLASQKELRAKHAPRRRHVPVQIQMPDPVRILIPAIGVSAPVIPENLNADRTLQVPDSFSEAGWFTRGPEPGEPGPAVIVGHVDSVNGPGAFYHLRALKNGDLIKVALKNGWTVRYLVSSHLAAPKNDFPTKLVYGRTEKPTLRLITCDGQFDTSTGHYIDNYIVFARFDGVHRTN
jgi:LPXTG-site transpeptidase (sortase) family protein